MKRFYKYKLLSLLVGILVLAAIFRFYGLNWDQGYHLHPDERMITMVTERIHFPNLLSISKLFTPSSPLNPKFFAYGSFPIYLLKFVGWIFSFINPEFSHYAQLNLLGRVISVVADLGVIILIYLIGRKIWTEKVGLIAAAFYAMSVLPIQVAHFYAVDTVLNLFILLTLYQLVLFYDKPNLSNSLKIGLFFGLSLATKVSATVLIVAIGTALVMDMFLVFLKRVRRMRIAKRFRTEFINLIIWAFSTFKTPKRHYLFKQLFFTFKYFVIITVVSLIVFAVSEPYAIIDFSTFWRQTLEQKQMTKSAFTFPYTLQFVGTTPYIYHLKNFILWGVGLPMGLLMITSTIWLFFRLLIEVPRPGKENQEAKTMILVFFFIAYFIVIGRFAVKFMRYLLPLYGLFALFSAYFIRYLIQHRSKLISSIGKIGLITISILSFLWAVSFASIYSKPNTRTQASEWMLANIPKESTIAVESWDDTLPVGRAHTFRILELPMNESDMVASKWTRIHEVLREADYIVVASQRNYASLRRLTRCEILPPDRCYKRTAQYYDKLFAGQLIFVKVAEFSVRPTIPLVEWVIDDFLADESFTVYDHPKVMIFKKEGGNFILSI